jgi:hypothetical protein
MRYCTTVSRRDAAPMTRRCAKREALVFQTVPETSYLITYVRFDGASRAMAKTGLRGPYQLTFDGITGAVTRQSAGVYVLGHTTDEGKFRIQYIGRSDSDVRETLRGYIGSNSSFKYGYYPSSKDAFLKECDLYHDFSPPGNKIHPDRPKTSSLECPRCRFFGAPRPRG